MRADQGRRTERLVLGTVIMPLWPKTGWRKRRALARAFSVVNMHGLARHCVVAPRPPPRTGCVVCIGSADPGIGCAARQSRSRPCSASWHAWGRSGTGASTGGGALRPAAGLGKARRRSGWTYCPAPPGCALPSRSDRRQGSRIQAAKPTAARLSGTSTLRQGPVRASRNMNRLTVPLRLYSQS